jgi:Pretoxin HINT domain
MTPICVVSDSQIQPASDALALCLPELTLGEPYLTPVYNFEVDEFHTYYVAEVGVWVHNTNCTPENAISRALVRGEEAARLQDRQVPCFAAGTLVHTKEGLKPIEDIRIDDWVLSYPDDQSTPDHRREEHEYTYRKVAQTFVTEDQPVSKLIVSNLASGKRETIMVTANHPIYCQNRGWIPVSDIEAGDVVENFLFGHLMVFRVYHAVENARVYNFEVDEFHTYYVGEQGVWVHNQCEITSTKVASLEALTAKTEIYNNPNYRNYALEDSTANTGKIGEDAGNIALYKSTGLDFRTDMRKEPQAQGVRSCNDISQASLVINK